MIKAIRINGYGDHSVLNLDKIELPPPSDHEVLVQHEAIGVNFIDIYHRSGLYPLELPSGLGKEATGTVAAVGNAVTRVAVGDRVGYVAAPLGAYAEAHLVPEDILIKLPAAIPAKDAAGMLLKGLTAAYLLLKTYPVTSTDTILVHAAAGGVGSILTQWAKAIGATVIGSVGSVSKVDIARQNGCDEVLLYREIDLPAAVIDITSGRGVDVVYDSVGKDTFDISLRSLKCRGMLVSFGNASGPVPDFSPLLLTKMGSLYLTRPSLFDYVSDPKEQQLLAEALFERVIAGDISIQVNHEFPLADAALAQHTLESGQTTGSIILLP
ncbi:MAG: quinone oxidoreductase [Gammaproteobacteria bacterium]|nr:quinone oxidoreductase [Gammaproteobacteria bacterium]